ncbi:hypothetical protein Ddc_17282 [Ditylenchus destructor]|nr:hypothetical protein Ddc_17282 [Ditylenchus destructor]
MKDLEYSLCTSPQTSQNEKCQETMKRISLCIPAEDLESLREQFGQFIVYEDQSETSECSSIEWSSDLIQFSDEKKRKNSRTDTESTLKRVSAVRKSLLSAINLKSELPILSSSDSENEKPATQKVHRKPKITKAAPKNIETSSQDTIRQKTQIGSFVFADSSDDEPFVEFRKGSQPPRMISALQNDHVQLKMSNENNVASTKKPDEAHSSSNSDTIKALSEVQILPTVRILPSVKSTSVISGRLELHMKNFIEWSFLLQHDCRHLFVSKLFSFQGYPFHIEINSNPLGGNPGQGNEYLAFSYRRFGILLVCDYNFPDPTLRLASNFVITLKAKNSKFKDHTINCSAVFSACNKTGGSLVASEFFANPENGLLRPMDTMYITIDVNFIASR